VVNHSPVAGTRFAKQKGSDATIVPGILRKSSRHRSSFQNSRLLQHCEISAENDDSDLNSAYFRCFHADFLCKTTLR
jgi:hypothetical protein